MIGILEIAQMKCNDGDKRKNRGADKLYPKYQQNKKGTQS